MTGRRIPVCEIAALAIFRMLLLACGAAPGSWINVGPGGGGWLPSVCVSRHDSNRMYAGCDVAGCFLSDDAGVTWRNCSKGLSDYFVGEIVEHPILTNVLFASTWSGVNKSIDGGNSWQVVRSGFPPETSWSYSCPIACVRFDPNDSNVLYAFRGCSRGDAGPGAPRGEVYRSDDGGRSFRRIDREGELPNNAMIVDAAFAERGVILVAIAGKGVYRSKDRGETWTESNAGLPHRKVWHLTVAPSDPRVVYLAVRLSGNKEICDSGVYKSVDAGKTWSAASGDLPRIPPQGGNEMLGSWPKCLVVHPKDPNIVFAGMNGWCAPGVYRSKDGGRSWQVAFGEKSVREGWIGFWGPSVESLSIGRRSPYPIAFGTQGYLFRSDDLGKSWHQRYSRQNPNGTSSSAGLETTCLFSISSDRERKGRMYFGYYDIGLIVSDDNGCTLRRAVSGLSFDDASSCMGVVQAEDDPNLLWGAFGQWGRCDGVVAKSADRGASWHVNGPGDGWLRATVDDLTLVRGCAPDYTLACCPRGRGIALTRDGGCHWTYVSTNDFPHVRGVRSICCESGTVYAVVAPFGKRFGAVWSSKDAGKAWSRLSPGGLKLPDVKRIRVRNGELFVAAREWGSTGGEFSAGGAWHSPDRGKTWRRVFTNRFVSDVLPLDNGMWAIATCDHQFHDNSINDGVFVSADRGATWTNISGKTLTNRNVNVLAEDAHRPGILWAGTQGGSLFVCRVGGSAGKKEGKQE